MLKTNGLKLIMMAVILTPLLTACVSTSVVSCPTLREAPPSVLLKLKELKGNPEGERWVIHLSQTRDKLKECKNAK